MMIKMWKRHLECYMNELDDILNTAGNSDIGCFIEVDLNYPEETKHQTKNFPFCLKKISPQDKFSGSLKEMKPISYTQINKVKCDSTNKIFFKFFIGC